MNADRSHEVRRTAVSGVYGVVMFALAEVTFRLLEDGWSLGIGIAGVFVVSVSVILLRALAHSWKSAISLTGVQFAIMSGFTWWVSRHDGWSGIPVVLVAAPLFGLVLAAIGDRHFWSDGSGTAAEMR